MDSVVLVEASEMKYSFEELGGQKVVLKPFVASDITNEYVAWLNDPEVVKYSNQRFIVHTKETCKRYLDSFEGTNNLFLKIERKFDGLFVGSMTAYVSTHHKTVDVGIMIGRRSVWGSGIGQDAWNTLSKWLFDRESIRKITAGTMRCNGAMIRIFERSGMTLEAVKRKQELLDGVPQDLLYYAKFSDF